MENLHEFLHELMWMLRGQLSLLCYNVLESWASMSIHTGKRIQYYLRNLGYNMSLIRQLINFYFYFYSIILGHNLCLF